MSGSIGVIAADHARYSLFAASLTVLDKPEGTRVDWQIGTSIAENCNNLVRTLLGAPDLEWLWIMGDDHVFAPSALYDLLANDVDIVVPLCLQRNKPYRPVAYSETVEQEDGTVLRRHINLVNEQGLIEVHSSRSAGMLVKREVFESMDDPWFVGQEHGTGEDLAFCDEAREHGYTIHLDTRVVLGHITTATVWPVFQDGQWTFGFNMTGGFPIIMPFDTWETMM